MDTKDARKTYQPPTLMELGSVETLTQGPWGGILDGFFGSVGGFNPGSPRGGETS